LLEQFLRHRDLGHLEDGVAGMVHDLGTDLHEQLILSIALPAAAQTVTDRDTIKLNGTTWRLWGIDAPETKQWCGDYPAGV
jgi:endonuclease YncB( thermonuclease family)